MTIATDLRSMREYIAKHGFSPYAGKDGCSRCFAGAADSSIGNFVPMYYLFGFIGYGILPEQLIAAGWNTDDACAVLDIAADCAEAEGK